MRIQADVTRAPHQPASIEELDLDELRDDEILIPVATAGVCRTDISKRDQTYRLPQPFSAASSSYSWICDRYGV
jgi:aryl-alcohol dehydrogenase